MCHIEVLFQRELFHILELVFVQHLQHEDFENCLQVCQTWRNFFTAKLSRNSRRRVIADKAAHIWSSKEPTRSVVALPEMLGLDASSTMDMSKDHIVLVAGFNYVTVDRKTAATTGEVKRLECSSLSVPQEITLKVMSDGRILVGLLVCIRSYLCSWETDGGKLLEEKVLSEEDLFWSMEVSKEEERVVVVSETRVTIYCLEESGLLRPLRSLLDFQQCWVTNGHLVTQRRGKQYSIIKLKDGSEWDNFEFDQPMIVKFAKMRGATVLFAGLDTEGDVYEMCIYNLVSRHVSRQIRTRSQIFDLPQCDLILNIDYEIIRLVNSWSDHEKIDVEQTFRSFKHVESFGFLRNRTVVIVGQDQRGEVAVAMQDVGRGNLEEAEVGRYESQRLVLDDHALAFLSSSNDGNFLLHYHDYSSHF